MSKSLSTRIFIYLMHFVVSIHLNAQQSSHPNENRGNQKPQNFASYSIDGINVVLGSPTASGIVINIIAGKDATVYVSYYDSNDKTVANSSKEKLYSGEAKEISLNNLKPNSKYFYTIHCKYEGQKAFNKTAASYFSTMKSPSITFSFGVQGDSHPERLGKMFNADLYKYTIKEVSDNHPDFYFMLGDDFSLDRLMENNGLSKSAVEKIYKVQRYFWGEMGSNPPLFLVNGNHEQAAKYLLNGTADNAAVLAANARNKYFSQPIPNGFYGGDTELIPFIGNVRDYYSFEWGDALFVVIDPYWHSTIPVDNQPGKEHTKERRDLWQATIGDQQYQWLKTTLEQTKAKHKFVFAHHILGTGRGGVEMAKYFEWGGENKNGRNEFSKNRPGWELPIHQILVKNKVDIFFQGHDHLFVKQELDGVIYQTVPNPADDTYSAFNQESYKSGVKMPNSGFLLITVSAEEVKVEYKRSNVNKNNAIQNYSYTIK